MSKYIYNNIFINNVNDINEKMNNMFKRHSDGSEYNKEYMKRYINYKKFTNNTKIVSLDNYYIFTRRSINIGHNFLSKFFPFYEQWRKNKKKVLYLDFYPSNSDKFYDDFFKSVIPKDYVVSQDINVVYDITKCIIPNINRNRDLEKYPNHMEIIKEIRDLCYKNNNIKPDRKLIVLYDRTDLCKKNIKAVDKNWVKKNNILLIQDFITKYTFYQALLLLSKTKKFILPVGTGFFNYMFMDENAGVFEINPHKINSWGLMYKLAYTMNRNNFVTYITHDTLPCKDARQGDKKMDDHIIFTSKLKNAIEKFIK